LPGTPDSAAFFTDEADHACNNWISSDDGVMLERSDLTERVTSFKMQNREIKCKKRESLEEIVLKPFIVTQLLSK
jgi:hypothetical protein